MRTLVIAAHPDDEVLGCGGTMARLVDQGQEVMIAILGEGITSRYDQRQAADPAELALLQTASKKAAAIMGVREIEFLGLPDNRFDTVPILEVVKLIEGLISRFQPAVVYTQHGGDLNIDHVVTFRATLTATRPMAGSVVRSVFAYEVASSTEWSFQQFAPVFQAQRFVDISDTLDRKIDAMQAYESEARRSPHPRAPESLRAIAQRWGSVCGCRYAEAFSVVRDII